jgi:hypothetical protein
MRLTPLLNLILVMSASALIGCTSMQKSRIAVSVDSIASSEAGTKKRYVLMPGGKEINADDLQFQEFAKQVETVLAEQGFVKATELKQADVAIFLAYAIGDPKTYQYSYSVPTWGQTGVASSQTYGTVSSYGGFGTYSGSTTYTPTYGVTGSTTHIGTNTIYTRFMTLNAYDISIYLKDEKMSQVWKTSAVSTGSSGDLRMVFPYMAAAVQPYIGTNTLMKIELEIQENDPSVQKIRGLPSKQ